MPPVAAPGVEVLDGAAQFGEGLGVVERALDEADAFGQLLPGLLAPRRAGVLLDGVVNHLSEVLLVPFSAREAREGEGGRQEAPVGKVIDGGHELLAREVAGHPEHHESTGPCDPRQATIARIAQGVGHY